VRPGPRQVIGGRGVRRAQRCPGAGSAWRISLTLGRSGFQYFGRSRSSSRAILVSSAQ
jgi:hypothetical protein